MQFANYEMWPLSEPIVVRDIRNALSYLKKSERRLTSKMRARVDTLRRRFEACGKLSEKDHKFLEGAVRLASLRRLKLAGEVAEVRILETALSLAEGNKTQAAKLIGVGRTTLHEKVKRIGIVHTEGYSVSGDGRIHDAVEFEEWKAPTANENFKQLAEGELHAITEMLLDLKTPPGIADLIAKKIEGIIKLMEGKVPDSIF